MGKIYNSILAILVVCIGVLFFLLFKKNKVLSTVPSSFVGTAFPVAFFEPDSIINNFSFSKQRQKDLDNAVAKANEEIAKMNTEFELKNKEYEAIEPGDDKERVLMALQDLKALHESRKETAQQNIEMAKQKFQVELRKNIEDFLVHYNTPKRFSYIMINDPNIMYYKDSALNITSDIIVGLNEMYSK